MAIKENECVIRITVIGHVSVKYVIKTNIHVLCKSFVSCTSII